MYIKWKRIISFFPPRTFMASLFTLSIFNLPGIYFYLLCKTDTNFFPTSLPSNFDTLYGAPDFSHRSETPLLYLHLSGNFLWQMSFNSVLILSLKEVHCCCHLVFKWERLEHLWMQREGSKQWRTSEEELGSAISDRSKEQIGLFIWARKVLSIVQVFFFSFSCITSGF